MVMNLDDRFINEVHMLLAEKVNKNGMITVLDFYNLGSVIGLGVCVCLQCHPCNHVYQPSFNGHPKPTITKSYDNQSRCF